MDLWSEIYQQTDSECVGCIREWYTQTNTGVYLLDEIVDASQCKQECIEKAFDILTARALISRVDGYRCPYCKEDLSLDDVEAQHRCLHCDADLDEGESSLEKYTKFKVEKIRKRDVEWVITIHGMNTVGAWQEEFSWRLAQMYGYSIPVSIFKYGNIKIGALLYYRKTKRVREFADEIIRRQKEYGRGVPDVIAHSYGSLLLSEVLKSKEYREKIKLGRIILAGSIVRPNFRWNEVIERGQAEDVLCHYSDRDFTVSFAQFFIPGSGPSGRLGFDQRGSVAHVREIEFGHSDYFLEKYRKHVLNDIWEPFLTRGDAMSEWRGTDYEKGSWSPSVCRILSHLLKIILLLFLAVFVPLVVFLGFIDAIALVQSVFHWIWESIV